MFIAESTPSTITGHADTFALILTLVIGFRFNVMEYTSIDPETNTTVTIYKKGALRFFFDGVFRFREFYRSRHEPVRNVRITWGFSSRRESWHVCICCCEWIEFIGKLVFGMTSFIRNSFSIHTTATSHNSNHTNETIWTKTWENVLYDVWIQKRFISAYAVWSGASLFINIFYSIHWSCIQIQISQCVLCSLVRGFSVIIL